MTDRELDEIVASASAARTRWERDDPDWLAVVLDLAGNRVRALVEELRTLRGRLRRSRRSLDDELREYLDAG